MLSKKQLFALSSDRRKEYLKRKGLRDAKKVQAKETLLSDVQATQDALGQEVEAKRRTKIEGI